MTKANFEYNSCYKINAKINIVMQKPVGDKGIIYQDLPDPSRYNLDDWIKNF
jgi:predicted Zn-dependent protease